MTGVIVDDLALPLDPSTGNIVNAPDLPGEPEPTVGGAFFDEFFGIFLENFEPLAEVVAVSAAGNCLLKTRLLTRSPTQGSVTWEVVS